MNRSLGMVLLFLSGGPATAIGQDARDAVALDPTHPAQAFWIEDLEHSWEVLSGHLHAFGVEVNAARGVTAGR